MVDFRVGVENDLGERCPARKPSQSQVSASIGRKGLDRTLHLSGVTNWLDRRTSSSSADKLELTAEWGHAVHRPAVQLPWIDAVLNDEPSADQWPDREDCKEKNGETNLGLEPDSRTGTPSKGEAGRGQLRFQCGIAPN